MKVVIAHNFYRSLVPSGENTVVNRETELLKGSGVECFSLSTSNDKLDQASFVGKLKVAFQMAGSRAHKNKLKIELSQFGNPGILHAHNLMPMFGYDLFEAAKELGYQTVQTLHHYQLIAEKPQNNLDDNEVKRLNTQSRGLLDFFYKKAYRNFWQENKIQFIDKFICLTEFQKQLMLKAGLPSHKLFVKPNFLPDPQLFTDNHQPGDYAIFVGRLSEEKGIVALTQAWQKLSIPLYVVGSGPLASELPKASHIHYLGPKSHDEVMQLIARARFLVMNSTCYETFGLSLIEALACGVPCLVPNRGAFPELIQDAKLGYVFEPENMQDMQEKAVKLWGQAVNMKADCRVEYLDKYSAQINLDRLLSIYQA
ncbi:MAG: glycosyltransferase [Gammaproteobacteria bacterium]|jgi:glycosyltransferase involved in cell wall biosynthesis|nr:glycosyltransferase [Gammaproteobacteria bacterium]